MKSFVFKQFKLLQKKWIKNVQKQLYLLRTQTSFPQRPTAPPADRCVHCIELHSQMSRTAGGSSVAGTDQTNLTSRFFAKGRNNRKHKNNQTPKTETVTSKFFVCLLKFTANYWHRMWWATVIESWSIRLSCGESDHVSYRSMFLSLWRFVPSKKTTVFGAQA